MIKYLLFLPCVLFSISTELWGQEIAITGTGDEVILFQDGTWRYKDDSVAVAGVIELNPETFAKPESATFLLKSNRLDLGIWLDPKKWSFKKAVNNPQAEYEFELKNGDLYGMIIVEKVEIPLETLRKIAVENGKEAAPDLRVVREEYREVNGLKVLLLQMHGTMQGIKFAYYGYYFSNENGSVQFITYTAQNLLDEYKSQAEGLLNGMVVTE